MTLFQKSPRRFARRWIERIGNALIALGKRIYQSPAEHRMGVWWSADKAATLATDYDLDDGSLVLDLGGYKGQWAADVFATCSCQVHVFEPVAAFAQGIERRFAKNARIWVHHFALAARDGSATIALAGEGSSIFGHEAAREDIRLVRAADWLDSQGIGEVDLMKINIEGGEYDLLEHLIETGAIRRIRHILVQFHDFVPDAERRMVGIQTRLAATHEPMYQYTFVWESWRRRTEAPEPRR